MPDFVFAPPAQPSVAVAGGPQRFPVRRIFCVGRNYAAHARELGNDERDPPFFFTKPGDAVVDSDSAVPYPPLTEDLHFEVELVVAIGRGGAGIAAEDAAAHIFGYGVGIDLTRRDLQDVAKKAARPWDWAKAFDSSAPCGPLRAGGAVPQGGRIALEANGVVRQQGDLAEMIWTVPEIVASCSRAVTLAPGDLIFTGTPAGVGATVPGDVLTGTVEGVGEVRVTIGPRS